MGRPLVYNAWREAVPVLDQGATVLSNYTQQ